MDDVVIKKLMEENETLRERIRQLEDICSEPKPLPRRLGLTKREDEIVRILLVRGAASHEFMRVVIYGEDEQARDLAKVFICKARDKLRRWGIVIGTKWGWGYDLPEQSREKFRTMIAEAEHG